MQANSSKTVKNKRVTTLTSIIGLFAIALFLSGCMPAPEVKEPSILEKLERNEREIIGSDVFALDSSDFKSNDLTVLGIKLGNPDSYVLSKLGEPDIENEYDFGAIRNWEYGESLGLNETGVVFHMRNGYVTRILVTDVLNEHLVGTTKVGGDVSAIYNRHGLPDRQYEIPSGRYFVYNEQGLEIYFAKGKEISYALVLPNRKLPTTASVSFLETNYTMPVVPKLITDTTTMCDEGETRAYNPGTGECWAYENSCVVPSHWIEVKSCKAEDLTREALIEAIIG